MRAMAIDELRAEPTLHDLPPPAPGDGELLIAVQASSVNGFDMAVTGGMIEGMMPYQLPITLGRDLAGVVEATGPGVTGFAVGERVFGVLIPFPLQAGAFAERAAVATTALARVPQELPIELAGALGLAGTTAVIAIESVAPESGDTVLVAGAPGGVGSLAVQLTKARGATVIATARPDQVEFVRGLGADETVDRSGDLGAAVRALRPDGVQAVVHAAGDGVVLAGLVAPGGRVASALGLGADHVGRPDIEVTSIVGMPSSEVLDRLAAAVASGDLQVPIDRAYPLADVPAALDHFRRGKRGKIAIRVA